VSQHDLVAKRHREDSQRKHHKKKKRGTKKKEEEGGTCKYNAQKEGKKETALRYEEGGEPGNARLGGVRVGTSCKNEGLTVWQSPQGTGISLRCKKFTQKWRRGRSGKKEKGERKKHALLKRKMKKSPEVATGQGEMAEAGTSDPEEKTK